MVGQWQPVNTANSIDMVAIVLTFGTPIPDLMLQRVLSAQEGVARRAGLTDIQPMQGFQISFGGPAGAFPTQVSGRLMTAVAVNERAFNPGFSEQVQFDGNAIVYRCANYTSWSEALARYLELFRDTLTALAEVIAPATVRLEYLDRFVHDGSEAPTKPSGLLRDGSKYVAPHVFNQEGMWHSHTGAFLPKLNGRANLLQINVDALDMNDGIAVIRSLQIMSAREDRFSVDSIELDRGAPDMIEATLNEMHSELMQVYKEVVSDEIAEAIGLTS